MSPINPTSNDLPPIYSEPIIFSNIKDPTGMEISNNNLSMHIVGLNSCAKERLITGMKDSGIVIRDIDRITDNIRNTPYFIRLYKKIKEEDDAQERRELMKQIHDYWRRSLHRKLHNLLTRHRQRPVILLGLSTFHKDHRIRVLIRSENRWFLKADSRKCARELVEYNLDKYKSYIISGSFPLKFIDTNFLIEQRNRIHRIYRNMGYKDINHNNMMDRIKALISKEGIWEPTTQEGRGSSAQVIDPLTYVRRGRSRDMPRDNAGDVRKSLQKMERERERRMKKGWFTGAIADYHGSIKPFQMGGRGQRAKGLVSAIMNGEVLNEVRCFDQPWMAMVEAIPHVKHCVDYGYKTDKERKQIPYIRQIQRGGFECLKQPCYLYRIDWSGRPDNPHSVGINKEVSIIEKIRIPNVWNHLQDLSVDIVY